MKMRPGDDKPGSGFICRGIYKISEFLREHHGRRTIAQIQAQFWMSEMTPDDVLMFLTHQSCGWAKISEKHRPKEEWVVTHTGM